MRTMTRTVWVDDPDAPEGSPRVRLLKGTEAPSWYVGGHVDSGETDDDGDLDRAEAAHPAGGAEPESGRWTVPRGSIPTIMREVAGDPDRARQALFVERSEQQRPTLIDKLERIIADDDAQEAAQGDETGSGSDDDAETADGDESDEQPAETGDYADMLAAAATADGEFAPDAEQSTDDDDAGTPGE